MDVKIDSDGVRMMLAGEDDWRPCEPGVVLAAARNHEFFLPAANVVDVGADVVRATVDGLLCSFDLARYGVATISEQGAFFALDSAGCRSLIRRP